MLDANLSGRGFVPGSEDDDFRFTSREIVGKGKAKLARLANGDVDSVSVHDRQRTAIAEARQHGWQGERGRNGAQ